METEGRKSTFKEIKPTISGDGYDYKKLLSKYVTEYDNDTKGLDTMVVKEEMSNVGWNNHLLEPLVGGATVFVHPDQTRVSENYIRVIHGERKAISIFSIFNFER